MILEQEAIASLFKLDLRIFTISIVLSIDVIDAQNLSSLHWKNLVKSAFHSKPLKLLTIALKIIWVYQLEPPSVPFAMIIGMVKRKVQ